MISEEDAKKIIEEIYRGYAEKPRYPHLESTFFYISNVLFPESGDRTMCTVDGVYEEKYKPKTIGDKTDPYKLNQIWLVYQTKKGLKAKLLVSQRNPRISFKTKSFKNDLEKRYMEMEYELHTMFKKSTYIKYVERIKQEGA